MMELFTQYMGLDLPSPVIAGSCSLTDNPENLKALEEAGAGAVVLKSVFEEEIYLEHAGEMGRLDPMEANLDFLDYFDVQIRSDNLRRYLDLIAVARAALRIPVIASINCVTSREWSSFARKIESAGASGLELNLFAQPASLTASCGDTEKRYYDTIGEVLRTVRIPVAVKISPYFSNLGQMISGLSQTGIRGIVLFNRFYSPDIDIERETVKNGGILSNPGDYLLPLRWTGMMYRHAGCDLSATTGIHDWQTAVKMILAGAATVQLASLLYTRGLGAITEINRRLSDWMEAHRYATVAAFRGKLALGSTENPAAYERTQFMKTFADFRNRKD